MEVNEEPLTKAKLFTTALEDGSWTEMGVGVVSVVLRPDTAGLGGEAATETTSPDHMVAQLEMVAVEDASDLLMSTPITLEDAYLVQHDAILVWSDPQLGRDMACSFSQKEGCDKIIGDIKAYQLSRKQAASNSANGERTGPAAAWEVRTENLQHILVAATTNTQRFGIYVRDRETYFRELAELFTACSGKEDANSMDLIGQITLVLLRSPFNTEGRIIAQFVENSLIDRCIDIVQHALGRRTAETGFVSFEERRRTFRNPCGLNEAMQGRIHVLYSCGYLKDLLPLSLDEGDAMSASLLSAFLVRFKYTLIEEICKDKNMLSSAFTAAQDGPTTSARELLAFIHDLAKTVKNAVIPLEPKEELFECLVRHGMFPFLQRVLSWAIGEVRGAAATPPTQPSTSSNSGGSNSPQQAIQMACDTLCHAIMLYPGGRSALLEEAASSPRDCLLRLVMESLIAGRTSGELQSAYDAAYSCGIGLLQNAFFQFQGTAASHRRDILAFWAEGDDAEKPPLFDVAAHAAAQLRDVDPTHPVNPAVALSLHYVLRFLSCLAAELDEELAAALAELLRLSGLVEAAIPVLSAPSRRLANLQSSITALVAALVESGREELLRLCGEADGVVDHAVQQFLTVAPRGNMLAASLAHLLDSLCTVLHREKSRTAGGGLGGGAVGRAPYVRTLRSVEDAGGEDPAVPTGALTAAALQTPTFRLVTFLVGTYGKRLEEVSPHVAGRLARALEETPEEALLVDAETSSVASTMERSMSKGVSDLDFDLMLNEYGPAAVAEPLTALNIPGAVPPGAPSPAGAAESEKREKEKDLLEESEEAPDLKKHRADTPTASQEAPVG